MTALDTNVLVRFLVSDDEVQASRARALMRRAASRDEQLMVTDVVACELVWVLESGYDFAKKEIATTVHSLLRARQLRFQRPDEIKRALSSYEKGRGDFSDYVIREVAQADGAVSVATFDKKLWTEPGFERVPGSLEVSGSDAQPFAACGRRPFAKRPTPPPMRPNMKIVFHRLVGWK